MDFFNSLFDTFSDFLKNILPGSPFTSFLDGFSEKLSIYGDAIAFLNWFFPVRTFLSVFQSWLTALSIYYTWSVIMRWVKIID